MEVLDYEMVYIAPGVFLMGQHFDKEGRSTSASPSHPVILTQGYYIGATEVTQGMWRAVMGDLSPLDKKHFIHVHHPPEPCRDYGLGDSLPMYCLTWFEAVTFANALSEREGLQPCYVIDGEDVQWPEGIACQGYRLPTEAEWEYAARAGTTTDFWSGDDPDVARKHDNLFHEDQGVEPVGLRSPNPWGLFDVHGNVTEWCWDWYVKYPFGTVIDPIGPQQGESRIQRGGDWGSLPFISYSKTRHRDDPDEFDYSGLRLAKSLPAQPLIAPEQEN